MRATGRKYRNRQWPSGRQYQKYHADRMSKLTAENQELLRWPRVDYQPSRPPAAELEGTHVR